MSEWLLPAVVLGAALASTYLFCLRPMRGGGCCSPTAPSPHGGSPAELDRALQEARQELARQRARCHVPARPESIDRWPDGSGGESAVDAARLRSAREGPRPAIASDAHAVRTDSSQPAGNLEPERR